MIYIPTYVINCMKMNKKINKNKCYVYIYFVCQFLSLLNSSCFWSTEWFLRIINQILYFAGFNRLLPHLSNKTPNELQKMFIHKQKNVYTISIINFLSFVAKVSFRRYQMPPVPKKSNIDFLLQQHQHTLTYNQ